MMGSSDLPSRPNVAKYPAAYTIRHTEKVNHGCTKKENLQVEAEHAPVASRVERVRSCRMQELR